MAVIIATIIEMILPENNNKKYIKMVIGVYILFSIISPIITIFKGKNYEFNANDYEKYFKNTYEVSSNKIEQNNDKNIEEIYSENLKTDIKQKLLNKGYNTKNISITIKKNEKNYGDIEQMELTIEENKENEINSISVNKVEINNTNKTNDMKTTKLGPAKIKEIKEYLSDTYNISKNDIKIN